MSSPRPKKAKARRIPGSMHLLHGIPGPKKTTIRFAQENELGVATQYVESAMGSPDPRGTQLPPTCPSMIEAADRGVDAYMAALAQQLKTNHPASFTLVAALPDGSVIGAAHCSPPYTFVDKVAQGDLNRMVSGVLGLSKLVGVAVTPQWRGHGVGAALVRTCRELLTRTSTMIMFGNATTQVGGWYRKLGFTVQSADEPLELGTVVFGQSSGLAPEPGHCFFVDRHIQKTKGL